MKKIILSIISGLLWSSIGFSQANLTLDLSVNKNTADIGEVVTFTIRVQNNGPRNSLNVDVLDRLPSGFEFVNATATMGGYDQVSGIWSMGPIGVGVTGTLRIEARVKIGGDYLNLAEIIASEQMDPNSIPNNGVDTDKDGNVVDDPQDEDDGDGQMVIPSGTDNSNCLAEISALSAMTPNPVSDINGSFKFDYKIQAIMTIGGTTVDNTIHGNRFRMDYYVNSADGSILFPGGPSGFFKSNFFYQDTYGRIDAAIWLANGQMVSYVYDDKAGHNRAITRESVMTAGARMGIDYLKMTEFFESARVLPEVPKPPAMTWFGPAVGYEGEVVESYTGEKNTMVLYFDKNPTPIKTSVVMMGFMVGVLKDSHMANCNRQVVYAKVNIGGPDSAEYLQVQLEAIKPQGITFDGSSYQSSPIDGDYGTNILAQNDAMEAQMRSIEIRRQTLQRERSSCMTDSCRDDKDAKLEALREEKERLICEMSVAMGFEKSVEECLLANQ